MSQACCLVQLSVRKEAEAIQGHLDEEVAKHMPNQALKTEMKRLIVARSGDVA